MTKSKPTKRRTLAAPLRPKAILVGVTDMRHLADPNAKLPLDELRVQLKKDGRIISPSRVTKGVGPRAFGHFETLAPGTYEARAWRKQGGKIVATAESKTVTLRKRQVNVDLFLHEAPELILEEARFVGDHGLLVPAPASKNWHRKDGKKVTLSWGDGWAPSKPEYKAGAILKKDDGAWFAASYTRGKHVEVEVHFKAKVPAGRVLTLESVGFDGSRALALDATTNVTLQNGMSVVVKLRGKKTLPNHIDMLQDKYMRFSAFASGARIPVSAPKLLMTVFVTFGRPTGNVVMHPEPTTVLFPDNGPLQSVTDKRLGRAVEWASGKDTEEKAVRKLFEKVRAHGVSYAPRYVYPEAGTNKNKTIFTPPIPPLHEYLWMSMDLPNMAHCLDLAAAFRLMVQILGIKGAVKSDMTIEQMYPWAPWDDQGKERDLSKDGEPQQAALRVHNVGAGRVVFVDDNGFVNRFEAVLRWSPKGTTKALLFPIGEAHVLDRYGPSVKPGPMDDRNASTFFEASKSDPKKGRLRLGVSKDDGKTLEQPAFSFLKNKKQTLFKFHYDKSTFQPGDDKLAKGSKLIK